MSGIVDALAALEAKLLAVVPEIHAEIPFRKAEDGKDVRKIPLVSCERQYLFRFRGLVQRDDGVVAVGVTDLTTTLALEVVYPAGGLDRAEDLDLELASDSELVQAALDREAAWPGDSPIARVEVQAEREDLEDRVLIIHRLAVFYRRQQGA